MCLPRSTIYEHYVDFCERERAQPINAASFGKVIVLTYFPTELYCTVLGLYIHTLCNHDCTCTSPIVDSTAVFFPYNSKTGHSWEVKVRPCTRQETATNICTSFPPDTTTLAWGSSRHRSTITRSTSRGRRRGKLQSTLFDMCTLQAFEAVLFC